MTQNGRQYCNALAGEKLPHFAVEDAYTEELVKKLVAPSTTPVAPLFNLVRLDFLSKSYEMIAVHTHRCVVAG